MPPSPGGPIGSGRRGGFRPRGAAGARWRRGAGETRTHAAVGSRRTTRRRARSGGCTAPPRLGVWRRLLREPPPLRRPQRRRAGLARGARGGGGHPDARPRRPGPAAPAVELTEVGREERHLARALPGSRVVSLAYPCGRVPDRRRVAQGGYRGVRGRFSSWLLAGGPLASTPAHVPRIQAAPAGTLAHPRWRALVCSGWRPALFPTARRYTVTRLSLSERAFRASPLAISRAMRTSSTYRPSMANIPWRRPSSRKPNFR